MRVVSSIFDEETEYDHAHDAMSGNISPVIIDNTNLALWQMKPYVEMVCVQQ